MSLTRFTYPIIRGLHWMVLSLIGLAGEIWAGSVLRVEVQPVWSDVPLMSGQVISPDKDGLRITRLDFLLSNLALRRLDGSWLESQIGRAHV